MIKLLAGSHLLIFTTSQLLCIYNNVNYTKLLISLFSLYDLLHLFRLSNTYFSYRINH